MAVGGSSTGSAAGGYYGAMTPSEIDRETLDSAAESDDFDDWDYAEMLSNLSKNVKSFVVQPLVIGAAAAFGMSLGYAIFDATTSIFSRKPSASTRR